MTSSLRVVTVRLVIAVGAGSRIIRGPIFAHVGISVVRIHHLCYFIALLFTSFVHWMAVTEATLRRMIRFQVRHLVPYAGQAAAGRQASDAHVFAARCPLTRLFRLPSWARGDTS